MRDNFGGIVTVNRIRTAKCRIGFEKRYFPGLSVSRFGWERSHSMGNIPVIAGPGGIVHAPAEISQYYQRLKIEQFLLEIFTRKAPDVEIWLSTTIYTHPCTTRVQKLVYRFEASRLRNSYSLYQATLSIEDVGSNPSITAESKELMSKREWYRVLK